MRLTDLFRRGANAADFAPDTAQEAMLRAAAQDAYAAEDAAPALRQRVALLAVQHDQQRVMTPHRRSHRLWRGLRQAACLAACACLLVGIMAWPNIKTAYLLYRMRSAILNARTLSIYTRHLFRTEATGGRKTASMTVAVNWRWVQNGKWHIESTIDWNAFFDGSHLKFSDNAPTHHVTVTDTVSPPEQYQWVGGISLKESPGATAAYGLFYTPGQAGRRVHRWSPHIQVRLESILR